MATYDIKQIKPQVANGNHEVIFTVQDCYQFQVSYKIALDCNYFSAVSIAPTRLLLYIIFFSVLG